MNSWQKRSADDNQLVIILEQVGRNFGTDEATDTDAPPRPSLSNDYCHRAFERDAECPPSQRLPACERQHGRRYCAMPLSSYLEHLRASVYVASPAGEFPLRAPSEYHPSHLSECH